MGRTGFRAQKGKGRERESELHECRWAARAQTGGEKLPENNFGAVASADGEG